MDLEIFNNTNKARSKECNAAVTFCGSGLISLNKGAIDKIGITEKDRIEIVFDKKEAQWYIIKSNKPEALKLYVNKRNYLSVSHALCVKKVQEKFEKTSKHSLRAIVSAARIEHEGQILIPLIMKPKIPGRNQLT